MKPFIPQLGVGVENNFSQIGKGISGAMISWVHGKYLRNTVNPNVFGGPFNS